MEKEIKSVLRKTVKIAGVTCFALGGAALIASGAALKALIESAKFVKTVSRISLTRNLRKWLMRQSKLKRFLQRQK